MAPVSHLVACEMVVFFLVVYHVKSITKAYRLSVSCLILSSTYWDREPDEVEVDACHAISLACCCVILADQCLVWDVDEAKVVCYCLRLCLHFG